MSFFRIPQDNETPDTENGVAGDGAVTGATDTGHASTQTTSSDGGVSTKSCRWFNFQTFAGRAVSVTLKITHTSDGLLSGAGASNAFLLEYSLNGGSSWNTAVSRTNVDNDSQGPTVFSVALPASQDVSQVEVRDLLTAITLDVGESSESTATIASIQLEVVPASGGLIVMM